MINLNGKLNFVNKEFGIKTLEMMKNISAYLISDCFIMDPIRTAEILSETDGPPGPIILSLDMPVIIPFEKLGAVPVT